MADIAQKRHCLNYITVCKLCIKIVFMMGSHEAVNRFIK